MLGLCCLVMGAFKVCFDAVIMLYDYTYTPVLFDALYQQQSLHQKKGMERKDERDTDHLVTFHINTTRNK